MSNLDINYLNDITGRVATLRELAAAIEHITGDFSEDYDADQRCASAQAIATMMRREAGTLCKQLERKALQETLKVQDM